MYVYNVILFKVAKLLDELLFYIKKGDVKKWLFWVVHTAKTKTPTYLTQLLTNNFCWEFFFAQNPLTQKNN